MLSLPEAVRLELREVARQNDCLIFGELHGTQEVPQLLALLLDDLTALGYGGLGLEIPRVEQEPLMQWGSGVSYVVPAFFTAPPSDGRGNEQALALCRRAVERGWQLLCFDADEGQPRATWLERDSAMSDNLAAQWQQHCPERKVLAVCGNLHSRLTPGSGDSAALWPSLAACLQQRNPRWSICSIDLVFHGGAFFNNYQVQTLLEDPLDEAELRDDPTMGHSLALHLPRATPPTFLTPPGGVPEAAAGS
jgi:hypothetical protein